MKRLLSLLAVLAAVVGVHAHVAGDDETAYILGSLGGQHFVGLCFREGDHAVEWIDLTGGAAVPEA